MNIVMPRSWLPLRYTATRCIRPVSNAGKGIALAASIIPPPCCGTAVERRALGIRQSLIAGPNHQFLSRHQLVFGGHTIPVGQGGHRYPVFAGNTPETVARANGVLYALAAVSSPGAILLPFEPLIGAVSVVLIRLSGSGNHQGLTHANEMAI